LKIVKGLLILLAIFLIACDTQVKQAEPVTGNVVEAILVNNTNSTNETKIIIIQKDVIIFEPRTNNLTLYFLDVSGDSVIVQHNKNSVLIDSGFDGDSEKILKSIRDLGITNIDYIFATNTQPKNIGGMPYIILRAEPDNVIEGIPSHLNKTVTIKNMVRLRSDATYSIGDFFVNVLVPYDGGIGFAPNLTDNSLVTKINYGNSKFLLQRYNQYLLFPSPL